jgi:hypothetical protein
MLSQGRVQCLSVSTQRVRGSFQVNRVPQCERAAVTKVSPLRIPLFEIRRKPDKRTIAISGQSLPILNVCS